MKNNLARGLPALVLISLLSISGCGVYSFSGASTTAETITVDDFFNNTDLAPANLAQNFTNQLKDYYQRNSSLNVVADGGQLHIEGIISEYRINPISPVSSGSASTVDAAALTRLTIAVRVSYEDTVEPRNSFKDRSFSFYADFPNTQDLSTVQEDLERTIFQQILLDIFNATVANW